MSGRCKVLAVASGGGHWVQLMRLKDAFHGHDVAYATVQAAYAVDTPAARFYTVRDATRWDRWGLVVLACQLAFILLRERPNVVITTGAAPGVMALMLAKILRARTIWVDSIANVEAVSMSGQHARRFADLWLTQWPHLADVNGPRFEGSVL